jgi:hypothetical protein
VFLRFLARPGPPSFVGFVSGFSGSWTSFRAAWVAAVSAGVRFAQTRVAVTHSRAGSVVGMIVVIVPGANPEHANKDQCRY